jgi:hypothetical protein
MAQMSKFAEGPGKVNTSRPASGLVSFTFNEVVDFP